MGLVSVGLLFASIIAISTVGEPSFLASAEQARAFFINGSQGWVQTATALTSIAAIGLIWFVVGLSLLLGRAEGSPPWRSAVALASGIMLPAYLRRRRSGSSGGELRVRRRQPRVRQCLGRDGEFCGVLRMGDSVNPSRWSLARLVGNR